MLKLGIIMDPISSINIKKDSSFAMLLEAQRRGYTLYYMEMNSLYLLNGKAYAKTAQLRVKKDPQNWFELSEEKTIALAELDTILMRKDPPFDTEYIYATYMLEHAENDGVLIVNKPQSLRDCNEKIYTTWFPELAPKTLVTRDKALIKAFHQKHGDIILKPLDGMGGSSIFRAQKVEPNLSVIIETLTAQNTRYCMVQTYLPEITQGDKRILIVNGEVVPYCLARIPQQGEVRGNLAAGGSGEVRPLTESDKKIAAALAPILKQKGLLFVGLDVIGNHLTEINVTSPTCICQIEEAHPDISITGILMDAIEHYCSTNPKRN